MQGGRCAAEGFSAGSIWEVAGREYGVPSELLYAIAIQESKVSADGGVIAWPWRLRVDNKAYKFESLDETVIALESFIASGISSWKIDVGIMQTNLYWTYERRGYDKLYDLRELIEPRVNIGIGAAVLKESLVNGISAESVGAYHNPKEPRRSNYGQAVLRIYKEITADSQLRNVWLW
jgi:soluble lytic murein transglycosylase-like protein